jgi:hypothetical protein
VRQAFSGICIKTNDMKIFLIISSFLLLTTYEKSCKNKKTNFAAGCYKGRLEVKGGCMNYTISITGGNYDPALVEAKWTDTNTGKEYKNAFALGSRCTFPETVNEGDEFYFTIDSTTVQNCAVCMMYYPVPAKHLSIKVMSQPCNQ